MNIIGNNKIIDRLDKMIDNAIEGKPIESGFDENKISQLETKLAKYLNMNNATKEQLTIDRNNINRLISDISHQTKTPISNILLYSQLLLERPLSSEDKLCVEALVEQSEKLDFLISSLVKASRLETGIITLERKPENLSLLLESLLKETQTLAENKNINILFEKTDAKINFDFKWTKEALINIINNAIKYTHEDGTIKISVEKHELFCKIKIVDTGIGIDEYEREKIFSRFYRSKAVRDYDGVGLGLYLSREIIVAQGGYIKVNSKLNQGSTFSVFLPN